MNLVSSLHSFGSLVANAALKIYNAIPQSVRAIMQGKIAEANLSLSTLPGADKRQWVAEEMAKLTGIAEGIWHGLVHLGVEELKAKAPAALQPYVAPVGDMLENAADAAGDKLIGEGAAKIGSPFAQVPSPAPPPNVVTITPPIAPGLGESSPPPAAPVMPAVIQPNPPIQPTLQPLAPTGTLPSVGGAAPSQT